MLKIFLFVNLILTKSEIDVNDNFLFLFPRECLNKFL